jgi:hypothetical protein
MDDAEDVARLLREIRSFPQVCCGSIESPSKHGCGSWPRHLTDQRQWTCFVTTLYPDGTLDTQAWNGDTALQALQAARDYVASW